MKQKILKYSLTALVVLAMVLLLNPIITRAAANLGVSPSTSLTNGQSVTVSGTGYAASSTGSILECNDDPNQPTVSFYGNPIAVSCSNPLSALTSTDSSGNLAGTSFTITSGTVGPPTSGTDSTGGNAATDAAAYPCPPTQAQINAGYSCDLSFGDQSGDTAGQNISFAGQPTPQSSSSTPTTTTTTTTSTTTAAKKASNTTATPTTTATTTIPTTPTTTQTATSKNLIKTSDSTNGSVTVAVDTINAKPMAGTKVTLDGKQTATTDSNGLATFKNVSNGKHTITIPGFPAKQVSLANGQAKFVSIEVPTKKSFTIYYIVAAFIVVFIGLGLVYLILHHRRSQNVNSNVTSGPIVVGSATSTSPAQAINPSTVITPTPTIAQPAQTTIADPLVQPVPNIISSSSKKI